MQFNIDHHDETYLSQWSKIKRKQAEEKKRKSDKLTHELPKLTEFFVTQMSQTKQDGPSTVPIPQFEDKNASKNCNVESEVNLMDLNDTKVVEECHNNNTNDPDDWTDFNNDDITYWINRGPSECQHHWTF